MQQGGSQYGMSPEMIPFTTSATSRTHMLGSVNTSDHLQTSAGDTTSMVVEAASPISSRPPAAAAARSSGNFEELVPVSGGFPDEEETERGASGGNRWPRQETIALLKIRSEMDTAFRDATLKGPLWDDVSRKLAQQGYIRSAKKCKEKFENVHKYYKRTKEGRAGRQDGKSYRFFSQLEALHTPTITTASATVAPAPVSIGIGMVGSSARPHVPPSDPAAMPAPAAAAPTQIGVSQINPPDLSSAGIQIGPSGPAAGISFSSNTSSASSDSDDDFEEGPSNTTSRKRKRGSGGSSSNRKMMEFFEGLMKQVMEKQEVMQQRFLETIEKREQDRMIREEAWKRQEMARLTREHEIMAQERAISASRDAAIIAFLQKMTGQTIQFPPAVVIPAAPPPPPAPPQPQPQPPPPPQTQQQQQHHHHHTQQQQKQHHPPVPPQSQNTEIVRHQQPITSTEVVVAAIPEQQHPPQDQMISGSGSFDPSSSRWPKAEVLALIKLRSGLESRYQEAGPKGPLWEEISAGMQRMGYNRSSKRCKEKWENINKYFKKVKESNKKRPEDAKTCPYFHQLDALYRKKMLGSSSSSTSFGNQQNKPADHQDSMAIDPTSMQAIMPPPPSQPHTTEAENKNKNRNLEEEKISTTKEVGSFDQEGSSTSGAGGAAATLKKVD